MEKKRFKLLITIFFVIFFCLIISKNVYANEDLKNVTKAYFCSEITKNYNNGDCILLENYDSKGNKIYGLIDTGRYIATKNENGENSTVVNEFLKSHGVTELEFVIITHSHGDHNGDAITVLNNFNVKKIYMKQFDNTWSKSDGYQGGYENIIKNAVSKNIKIIGIDYNSTILSELSPSASESFKKYMNENSDKQNLFSVFDESNTSFKFGSSKMKLYNWEIFDEDGNLWTSGNSTTTREKTLENNNSLCILLTQGNKKAVFSGDMNNLDKNESTGRIGDENRVKDEIGKVDFLKLGHHGYEYSNTEGYLQTLNPKFSVITNDIGYAFKETIDWLEEHNVDYLYSTNDEKSIIVTLTEDDVYMNFEKTNGFKKVNNKLYYFPKNKRDELKNWKDNVCQKIEYVEETQNASSWKELKKIIEKNKNDYLYNESSNTMQITKLNVKLTTDNFIANSTIIIDLWQNIELTTDKKVSINRSNDLKTNSLFTNFGNLSIGEEKMGGNITFDGKNIESTACLLENYGVLNIYENVTLKNNYKKISSLVNQSTTISYSANGSAIYCSNGIINMYGGKIIDNKNSVDYELVLDNKVITNNYDLSCYGTGVYLNNKSQFNMYYGEISNNYAENNSVVNIKNNTTNKNSREISQKICGVGIASNNSSVNIKSGIIEKNIAKNKSKLYIKDNSEIYCYRNKNYGVAIYGYNSQINIDNTKIMDNTAIIDYVVDIDNSKVNDAFITGVNGIGIYTSVSSIDIKNSNIFKNIFKKVNNYANIDVDKKYEETNQGGGIDCYEGSLKISNTTIEENMADQGGGIYFHNAKVDLDNVTLNKNTAKFGGGLYANGSSNTNIIDCTIKNNTTNEGSGGGIYAYGKIAINGSNTKIINNTAKTYGGGIMVKNTGIINDGEISNNKTQLYAGGGVRVDGNLTMNGGTVQKNSSETTGGGIDYSVGTFKYNGGIIEDNTAKENGNNIYPQIDEISNDNIKIDSPATLQSIKLKSKPYKTQYIQNYEKLDLEGGIIEAFYDDGTVRKIEMSSKDVMITGFDNSQLGHKTILVDYKGKKLTFVVEIITEENLKNDLTKYEENKTEEEKKPNPEYIDEEFYEISEENSQKYNEILDEEYIEVNSSVDNNLIKEIKICKHPQKIEYIQNKEELDFSDGEILITYQNSGTQKIAMSSPEIKVTGFDNNIVGEKAIKVNYKGAYTTYVVNITPMSNADSTTSNQILPNTGKTTLVIISIVYIIIFGAYHGKKYITYLKDTHKQL